MKKNIWIINHYAGNMLFDKGGRHYWFAKYLSKSGYSPKIFACNIKHNTGGDKFVDTEKLWEQRIADEINCPFIYVNARPYQFNGYKRVLNMIDFYRNVKKAALDYAEQYGKPDVILASSVHPLTMLAGIQLAKIFGIKCICEVRDLWPEAIVAYSKKITKNSLPARVMYAGEKWIYKNAAAVIFTQEGGPEYVCEHGWDKAHGGPIDKNKLFHINNGVDLEAFDKNLKSFPYSDADLNDSDFYKVLYCGAIRRINNLGLIIDAAKLINDSKIKFIIFGDGDELESLKKRVEDEKIANVVFKGRVNKQFIPSIVNKADLNIVHWEMNPLLRVGESYNKAFEYFAAGKPVFYTIRPGYSIVEKYNCGRLTEGFTPQDIANGIEVMAAMNEDEIKEMAQNARHVAEVYDFKNLTNKLIAIIESI